MRYPKFFVSAAAISAASLIALGAASAASVAWSGAGSDGLASNANNWSGGAMPVSGEDLSFASGAVAWDIAGVVPASFSSSADITLRQPLLVTGPVSLTGGSFKTNGSALNVGGDFTLSGAAFEAGSDSVNITGSWKLTSGSAALAASTVTLNGSQPKTILSGGRHFGNLTISASGASVSAADDLGVDGQLRIVAGTLSLAGREAVIQGGVSLDGGALSLGAGHLTLSGTAGRPLSITGGSLAAPAGSTVEYRPAGGSVTVEPAAYGDLRLSGNAVFALGGDASAAGQVAIASGATLSPSGHVLSVPGGDLANDGIITDGLVSCPARSLGLVDANGSAVTVIRSASGSIAVRVEDRDLNRRGSQAETVLGAVTVSTVGGDKETVNLVETGLATGIFQSPAIVVHQGEAKAGNGQIEVGQNDIIFAKYADPQDSADVKSVQATVGLSALAASGAPQIVSGPSVRQWAAQNLNGSLTYSAHIVWDTDRESASAVSVTSPQMTAPLSAGSLAGTTSHDVLVTGLVRGRQYSFTATSVTADGKSVTSAAKKFTVIADGDRLKSAASSAVYWYLGGKRNVFPDFTSYDSWFDSWNGVVTVPAEQLSDLPIGKVVPVRAGTYLVKIQSDPKTYAVEPYGKLRWVPTEAQAIALYGAKWTQRVRDLDVSQFASYTAGDPLAAGEAPDGFVYQVAGGELNVVIGHVSHPLSETARKSGGISSRFSNAVGPSAVAALGTGAAIVGYEPDLSGVAKDGGAGLSAPAVAGS